MVLVLMEAHLVPLQPLKSRETGATNVPYTSLVNSKKRRPEASYGARGYY